MSADVTEMMLGGKSLVLDNYSKNQDSRRLQTVLVEES